MNPGDCAIDHFLCFHRRSKSSSQPFATGILFDTTKTMADFARSSYVSSAGWITGCQRGLSEGDLPKNQCGSCSIGQTI